MPERRFKTDLSANILDLDLDKFIFPCIKIYLKYITIILRFWARDLLEIFIDFLF